MKATALLLIAGAGLLQPQEVSHTTLPKIIHRVEPKYTKDALAAKLEGLVVLSFVLDINGVPSDIKVVRGLGKGLDEKAEEALQQWRFSPETSHGEPVTTKATIEMDFRLSNARRTQ